MERGDLDGARSLFNEAAGIEPYCVEAVFNLGLASMRMEEHDVRGREEWPCVC